MNQPTYVAHDGQTYQWPPPDGWAQADDGRWYPQKMAERKSRSWRPWALVGVGAVAVLLAVWLAPAVARGYRWGGAPRALRAAGCEVTERSDEIVIRARRGSERCLSEVGDVVGGLGLDRTEFIDLGITFTDWYGASLEVSGDDLVVTIVQR